MGSVLTVYHQDTGNPCHRLLASVSLLVGERLVRKLLTKAMSINQSSQDNGTLDSLLDRSRRATAMADKAIITEHTRTR